MSSYSMRLARTCLALSLASVFTVATAQEWQPAESPLMTRWAEDVNAENPLPEYPRPQLKREQWENLNGLWEYAITERGAEQPAEWDGEILVPFAIESALSGVGKAVQPDQRLWYRTTFEAGELGQDEDLVLNFGAVDWQSRVWVNGTHVGGHQGGFDPFSFEISDWVKPGENELVVSVWDPTNSSHHQPHGKQVLNPHGIMYTAVTGIWQTVWLEKVNNTYVRDLRVTPDVDNEAVHVRVDGSNEASVRVTVLDEGTEVATAEGRTGREITVAVEDPKLWTPETPFLYDVTVELLHDGEVLDTVESYTGMRKIEVKKDENGLNRMYLNGEKVFQFGPLDQGWWPDGLYTAPTDEALKYDIEVTKELGFNMTRKHVKVEPARWYYWCDVLGLLVWQDMPSGGPGPDWILETDKDGPEVVRNHRERQQFYYELEEMVDDFYHFPSIVVWVPFNERWGQFNTEAVVAKMRDWDQSRLINSASGGNFLGVGDVLDRHNYPDPFTPAPDDYQVSVCGEFGGLGLPLPGHTWQDEDNWGYRSYDDAEALEAAYREKIEMCLPMVAEGLSAAVYTQITDVEVEVNGLLTYDREVIKIPAERVAEINRELINKLQ